MADLILWSSFLPPDAPPSWISLPHEIAIQRDTLIDKYTDIVENVGSSSIGGGNVKQNMKIRPNLSYWWLSVPSIDGLAIKSAPYSIVRLLLLTDIVLGTRPARLTLIGLPTDIEQVIESWATGHGIEIVSKNSQREKLSLRSRITRALPALTAARLFFTHLSITLWRRRPQPLTKRLSNVTVIDYGIFHETTDEICSPKSRFWGRLPFLLEDLNVATSFIHMPDSLSDSRKIKQHIRSIQAKKQGLVQHDHLYSYLTLEVLWNAIGDYLQIRRYGHVIREHPEVLVDNKRNLNLAPSLASNLRSSFFGRDAAIHAIQLNLWEAYCSQSSPQSLGLYLFENQPWELAFQAAWRSAHSGSLVGVPHTTFVPWDTRVFGLRPYVPATPTSDSMPWPDLLATNGPLMQEQATKGGYPPSRLTPVESLRFEQTALATSRGEDFILVLGEYSWEYSLFILQQARMLHGANELPLAFRPHPSTEIDHSKKIVLEGLELLEGSLPSALSSARSAIAGSFSSSSVDAALAGLPVSIIPHPDAFPGSPGQSLPGVNLLWTKGSTGASHLARAVNPVDMSPDLSMWRETIRLLLK